MITLHNIPEKEFIRVKNADTDRYRRLHLIADMCRANTLTIVKRAGSGHLGSSFSAMDIVAWLYYCEMNTLSAGLDNPNRDIYFSSKGHDVPGLYSVLFSLGILPKEKFFNLRRFGGLDGHPDISIPGIETNSGSLGMGISKGKGMALAKRMKGHGGQVFVLTGDGEWQEGQNYEALQSAAQLKLGNLNIIMDHNKVQTDKFIKEIIDLGDLDRKFASFGWHVSRCDGHDIQQIDKVLCEFRTITDRPKILVADTIKGRGISFMEHVTAMQAQSRLYPWHAGAPDDKAFEAGHKELIDSVNIRLSELGLESLILEDIEPEDKNTNLSISTQSLIGEQLSVADLQKTAAVVSDEYVANAYGQALVEIAAERQDIVVLDADLAADCRVRGFELQYPDRFIECGIAEQDMISTAGGLARMGLLPIVNSFASFLASRANEQIYNNATEKTKIIYACHYAGLIPAGPGKSHQSIRDISLFGALPNCIIFQPGNALETKSVLEYCVYEAKENCMIRLAIGPSPRKIQLPEDYHLTYGRGTTLTDGDDGLLFAYGPVMLNEALLASEILCRNGSGLKIINLPWLNRIDKDWLEETVRMYSSIYILEDHAPVGGLGDCLLNHLSELHLLNNRKISKLAVEGYPACGTPSQALRFHGLDGMSIAERILKDQG